MERLTFLNVPGWTGSGPGHWMSLWERGNSEIVRVEQADWNHPDSDAWVAELESYVMRAGASVVLIAHSCGVSTVQRWVRAEEGRIACAFLVAPPDPEQADAPTAVSCFGPMPDRVLPFPSLVVASRDDPTCSLRRAELFSHQWEARLVDVGMAGHLNTASGHGPWPEGKALLHDFIQALKLK